MKSKKLVGIMLLVLFITTVVGMVIDNSTYWLSYNYAVIIFAIVGAVSLLKK